MGDWDRSVGARRLRGVDSLYGSFEFRDRFPALDDGRRPDDGTKRCGDKLVDRLPDGVESGRRGSGEAYLDCSASPMISV